MDQEKMVQAIRKAIADRDAQSVADRTAIYDAARAALSRRARTTPETEDKLQAVIDLVEASYVERTHARADPAGQGRLRRHLLPFAIGAATGIVLAASATVAIPLATSGGSGDEQALATLQRQYRSAVPHVPAATDFLRKVSRAVVAMQATDPGKLEVAKGFINLSQLDAELAKQMPESLPEGSTVILRADAKDYKIMFNWTLCGAVRLIEPAMVDPVRSKVDALGCPYFGFWTPGAAQW